MPSTSIAGRGISLSAEERWRDRHTFLLEEHATLGHDDGHISVDVALAVVVKEADGDICVADADGERDAEDALRGDCAIRDQSTYTRASKQSDRSILDKSSLDK